MAVLQVKPTRMELARLKKRLASSTRGHRLLKDKRDDMIKRFIQLAEKNIELRIRLEEKMKIYTQDLSWRGHIWMRLFCRKH